MVMGECAACSILQVDSKIKFAASELSLRVGGYLVLTDFKGPKVNLYWLCVVDGSTINIVLCIIYYYMVAT